MESEVLTVANNQFSLNIFKILYEKHKDANSFLSPAVLGASLAAAYVGASGDTRKKISRVLRWSNNDDEADDERRLQNLTRSLRTLPDECKDHVILSFGIKIYFDKRWTINGGFKEKLSHCPNCGIESCNLMDNLDQVVSGVHSWISEVTHGAITEYVKMDSEALNQSMAVISCVSFKGKWEHGFDPKNTQPLPFVVAPGQSVDVPMMCITGRYPYIKDSMLKYSAIEIPYQGGRLGVVIILPDQYFGLGELLKNINLDTIAELLINLYMADSAINLIVPKFEVKNVLSLSSVLGQLGMEEVFQPDKASFSGITSPSQGLYLSSVIHSAVLQVEEEGTMPKVVAGAKNARPKAGSCNILKVRIDHPFLYVVVDKRDSNKFLFIGHVTNPAL